MIVQPLIQGVKQGRDIFRLCLFFYVVFLCIMSHDLLNNFKSYETLILSLRK